MIYCLSQRSENAISLLQLCLKIDGYNYNAYKKLCEIGGGIYINILFII